MAAKESARIERFPIFPLRTVLFPTVTLPIHVFEPRYREMVGRCLEHDESFGIVLILEGEEVGGPSVPHSTGTEAAIIASQRHADGRYDIVVEGRRRFLIRSLDTSRSYLRADVDWLDEVKGEDTDDLAEAVAKLHEGIVEALEVVGPPVIDDTWREMDARTLSYRVASTALVSNEIRQELLEIPDVATRLRREAKILMSIHRIGAGAGAA